MDKKIAGLLGAVAAVATMGGAQASTGSVPTPSDPLAAQSYADLLTPIPNATEALVADNARHDANSADGVQLAQYYITTITTITTVTSVTTIITTTTTIYYRYHHHHHHHHHGAFFGVPGVGGVIVR